MLSGLRLRVALRRQRLDHLLAEGTDPRGDAQLTLRAKQITASAFRTQLAADLRDIVEAAQDDRPHRTEVPALRRKEIRDAHDVLRDVAERLESPQRASAHGMALVVFLIRDSASPLYEGGGINDRPPLRGYARGIRTALDDHAR